MSDIAVIDAEVSSAHPLAKQADWGGACERGLSARQERGKIVASVLVKDSDFGIIPGTNKPTLLKPGAEKIADCLNLYPDYESLSSVEDFDKPLFFYRYRCVLRQRGTGDIVATGIGSCSSMEAKYRWKNSDRKCPKCGKSCIIKGKAEYGGGFLCFAKKGGCGAKFTENAPDIVSQTVGKVDNDDVCSLVNTIDKMGQKRALVAAALNLGFSEQFTQDVEDLPQTNEEHPPAAPAPQQPAAPPPLDINAAFSKWIAAIARCDTKEKLPILWEKFLAQRKWPEELYADFAAKLDAREKAFAPPKEPVSDTNGNSDPEIPF